MGNYKKLALITVLVVLSLASFQFYCWGGEKMKTICDIALFAKALFYKYAPFRWDEYDFLVNEKISIEEGSKGSKYRFDFENKYPGTYDVGILLFNFKFEEYMGPSNFNKTMKLKLQINFYAHSKLIMSRLIENRYSPFQGIGTPSGFGLMLYEVPKEIPLKTKISCEVIVIEPDDELFKTSGPISFYIRKYISD